jgi:hypothetical protein
MVASCRALNGDVVDNDRMTGKMLEKNAVSIVSHDETVIDGFTFCYTRDGDKFSLKLDF